MPEFTIIIPVYNGADYIGRTIESVLNQTYSGWELIIVNNGSTDNTIGEVEKFLRKDARITFINCVKNSGSPAHPRNLGLRQAQGRYIAFLDADDAFLPNKLSEVLNFFKCNPDADLICHGEEHVKNGAVIRRDYYGPYKTHRALLFHGNSFSTSAVIMKRICFEKTGLFSESKELAGFEDYDYWLRLVKVCRIGYLKKILGICNVNENGEGSRIAANYINALNFLDNQFSRYGRISLYYSFLMRRRKALCLRASGREFMKAGNYKTALELFHRAIVYYPFNLKQLVFALSCLGR